MPSDDRPMRRLSDLLTPKREPTRDERAAIEEVRTMALEWDAGRLPLQEVAKLSTGERRFLAARFTPPEHSAFRPLMRLLDALIAPMALTADPKSTTRGPVYRTKHGLVHEHELRDLEAKIEREEGEERIVFPVRYPWKVKPDREKGVEGVRLPAVYRSKDERKPEFDTFRVGPKPKRKEDGDDKPWWEDS